MGEACQVEVGGARLTQHAWGGSLAFRAQLINGSVNAKAV